MEEKGRRYFNKDHSPKRCTKCEEQRITTKTMAVDGGYASEVEYACYLCGTRLGYYAYGFFDPCFEMGYLDAGMYEATVLLYECKPLNARLSEAACKAEKAKNSKTVKFNNGFDYEGLPINVEACRECKGLQGKGEPVAVTAGPPSDRALVVVMYGGWQYV